MVNPQYRFENYVRGGKLDRVLQHAVAALTELLERFGGESVGYQAVEELVAIQAELPTVDRIGCEMVSRIVQGLREDLPEDLPA